jgi:hypothetical protein
MTSGIVASGIPIAVGSEAAGLYDMALSSENREETPHGPASRSLIAPPGCAPDADVVLVHS